MLEWSQDRRRLHEKQLEASRMKYKKSIPSQRIDTYDTHQKNEEKNRQTQRHRIDEIVSELAAFHEEEYVDFLKERNELRALRPKDRGKWKCLGTEMISGTDHPSITIAARQDTNHGIERQFWTWCGREIRLEKLVVESIPAFDGLSLQENKPHGVEMGTTPHETSSPLRSPQEKTVPDQTDASTTSAIEVVQEQKPDQVPEPSEAAIPSATEEKKEN